METERRQHRRLDIRLPLECCPTDTGPDGALRTVTNNVSTGGLYFELDLLQGIRPPQEHDVFDIELTVPPGDGYFPYHGRVTSTAEVLRRDELRPAGQTGHPRVGVAARFRDPLKLAF